MEEIPNQAWIRIILFLALAGGSIWYFSKDVGVAAEILPPVVSDKVKVLGEQVEKIIPQETKNKANQTVKETEEKIIKNSTTVIEESEIVKKIKETVESTIEEIAGFPEKQVKETKRKAIEQACEQLLEEVEDE